MVALARSLLALLGAPRHRALCSRGGGGDGGGGANKGAHRIGEDNTQRDDGQRLVDPCDQLTSELGSWRARAVSATVVLTAPLSASAATVPHIDLSLDCPPWDSTPVAVPLWPTVAARLAASVSPALLLLQASGLTPSEFVSFKLASRTPHTHNTEVFVFALAHEDAMPNLPVSSCVMTRCKDPAGGADIIRPYTPINTHEAGKLQLLVKRYEAGKMSKHIHGLAVGDSLEIKGTVQCRDMQRVLSAGAFVDCCC